MNQVRSSQQPKETNGVVGESEISMPFSKIPGPAAPPSPPHSPLSSPRRVRSSLQSIRTRPLTAVQRGSALEIQVVPSASGTSNNIMPVIVVPHGTSKIVLSGQNHTDQQSNAVRYFSEPAAEKKTANEVQTGSEDEIERLKKKIEDLTKRNFGLEKRNSELTEEEDHLIKVVNSNGLLRKGLVEATSILSNFLKAHALRKYVFFEWQKKEMSENDGETDEELGEHLKEVLKMIEVDYLLMRKENKQLKKELKEREHDANTYRKEYETTDKDLYNSQRLVEQLEAKVKELEGQAARGRENRAEKEQTAREEAAREQADREQQFAQLQHEKEELSEELNQAKEERAVQTERTAQVQRELDLEQRARVQAEQERAAEGQVQEQTRNKLADAQAQNDTLTQENNALRAQFGELQNQQNEIQWRNETLEAQVGLLLANFVTNQLERNTLINRCNEIREQRNEALRQLDIMREGNEDVALVYEDTVKNHEEEICYLLYQMAEMHGAAWPETGPWRITETLGEESKKPFNQSSQPKSGPPLRWVRRGRKLHLEYVFPMFLDLHHKRHILKLFPGQ